MSMCRSRQAHFFLRVFSTAYVCTCTQPTRRIPSTIRLENADEKNSNKRNSLHKRNRHLFHPRWNFCLTLWHPFDTPVLCGNTQSRYRYACKGRDLQSILAAASGFHFSPCAMRFIESFLHDVLLGKPRNFILPASSDFIVVAPWHAASSSHAADRQAYTYTLMHSSSWTSRASKPGWLTETIKKRGSPGSHEQEGSRVLCQVLWTRFQPPKKRNRSQRVCTRTQIEHESCWRRP